MCIITSILGVDQTLVSHHLALLRREKLVKTRSIGKYRVYSLADKKIIELLDCLIEK
ncbi:MAG: ArsR family transcriptional regulator [Thermoprotei archaeon]